MRIALVLWLVLWLIIEPKIGTAILPLGVFALIAVTQAKKEKGRKK
jgi:hypothetical protein